LLKAVEMRNAVFVFLLLLAPAMWTASLGPAAGDDAGEDDAGTVLASDDDAPPNVGLEERTRRGAR
jgi:hypothetical protein